MTGRNSFALATAIDSAELFHCVSYTPESMAAMCLRPRTRPIELIPPGVKKGKQKSALIIGGTLIVGRQCTSEKSAAKRSPGISLPMAGCCCSRVWITALRAFPPAGGYPRIGGSLRSLRSTTTLHRPKG